MLTEILKSYVSSAEYKALSPNSKRTYDHYIKKFADAAANHPLLGVGGPGTKSDMQSPVVVAQDVAFLSSVIGQFNGAQAQRMARRVMILLFGWGERYGFVGMNPAMRIPLPRLTTKQRSPFNLGEMQLLSGLIAEEALPARMKPYISQAVVAFHTGMRPSELDNLVWEDVGPDYISVRSAKAHEVGAVARLCKVTSGVAQALPARSTGLVFKSMTGKKLNKDTRSEAINAACKAVGIKVREFYNTRRGTATEMFRLGYDISAIQHQLGHADIATTQIYVKPSMVEAANNFRGF